MFSRWMTRRPLRAAARDSDLVVNAAGPTSETGPKLIAACLAAGTSYMDISANSIICDSSKALDARRSRRE